MDLAALDALLTVTNGVFTLAADTLPNAGLADLLARNNGGQPIRITQAVKRDRKRVGSGSRDSIPITGVATFLNVPDAQVEALFSLDGSGNPVFLIRFTLETRTGPARPFGWHFSTSFPNLAAGKMGPVGGGDPNVPATSGPLDGLTLTNPAFVLTNRAGTDGQVPLSAGLNFVSGVDPAPLLGVLGSIIGDHGGHGGHGGGTPGGGGPTLYGPVYLPLPTEVTPPLAPDSWPWEADLAPVPGLTLRVDVGQSIDIPGVDVHLRDIQIVLYTPISGTWLAANPDYQPSLGLIGTLSAPALVPGPILLTADIPFGWSSATFCATFTDAGLANLTGLGGLFGHSNLFAELPAPLRTAGQALGGISLRRIEFQVSIGDHGLTLDSAGAVVELPTLGYAIGDLVTLTAIEVAFFAVPPDSGGGFSIDVLIGGSGTIPALGASFDLDADLSEGVAYGSLTDTTLSLSPVFHDLGLPAPADLVIDTARIMIAPGSGYEFDATIAQSVPWTLDLGPVPVAVQDVVLVAAKFAGRPSSASLAGRILFGASVEVDALYRLPGAFVITGTFESVSLGDLVKALTDAEISLPDGFDIRIDQAYVCIDSTAGGLRFTASALIDGFGALAFTASRSSGHWGFAAGLDITEGLVNLESVPGLGALAELRALVGLTDLMIVVSSLDDPGFTFPQLAVPPTPAIGAFGGAPPALPAQAVGVGEGLTVYGQADLGASQGIQAIARWLGVGIAGTLAVTLTVSAPDPGTDSRLFISVSTTVDGIVVTGRLGFALVNRRPEVFLDGTALVGIQGRPVLFQLSAAVAANGVLISGGYQGTIHFDLGAGLGGFTLSNLGLVVGLDWEGIPSFGVAATIDVQTFESSVAVFFDSTDPSRSLLAGSVTQLSLYDVVATIAGQSDVPPAIAGVLRMMALKGLDAFTLDASVVASLDGRDLTAIATAFAPHHPIPSGANQVLLDVGEPRQSWHLTDLTTMTHFSLATTGAGVEVSYDPQLYCAPSDTQIGPNHFPQGFHVQTAVGFFIFDIDRLWIEISPTRGIAADCTLAPIVIGQADLFSITNAAHDGGPTLSISTYTRSAAEQPDPALRPPHVLVSGALRLLGTDFGSLYLNISESGIAVQISETVGDAVHVVLAGSVTKDSLALSGTLTVSVGGTIDLGLLGRIDVSTGAWGSLGIEFAADSLSATLRAGVTLPGLGTLTLPPIQLTVTGVPLGRIGGVIWDEIIETVTAAVQDATRWVGLVRDGLIQGIADAKQVAQVLAQQWKLTADAVGSTMHDAGYAANEIAEGMQAVGATAQDAAKALVGFGYAADVVGSAVGIFGGHTDITAGHFDTPGGPHGDFYTDAVVTGFHTDSEVPPHGDTGVHVDT